MKRQVIIYVSIIEAASYLQADHLKFENFTWCSYKIWPFPFFVCRLRERPAAQWSEEELLEKHILLKKWTLYKQQRRLEDLQLIDRMVYSQQRALDELKLASPRLYEAAIQV